MTKMRIGYVHCLYQGFQTRGSRATRGPRCFAGSFKWLIFKLFILFTGV